MAEVVERAGDRVRVRAGDATVEVTALAPAVFRVGFFPRGRPVEYRSEATEAAAWEPMEAAVRDGAAGGGVEIVTAASMGSPGRRLRGLRAILDGPAAGEEADAEDRGGERGDLHGGVAPAVFRVGFFPRGRPHGVSLRRPRRRRPGSPWRPPLRDGAAGGGVEIVTAAARPQLALDPLRIGFTGADGRGFVRDIEFWAGEPGSFP